MTITETAPTAGRGVDPKLVAAWRLGYEYARKGDQPVSGYQSLSPEGRAEVDARVRKMEQLDRTDVEPCPVPCDEQGRHSWNHDYPDFERSHRNHISEFGPGITVYQPENHPSTGLPEISDMYVEVEDWELRTPEEAAEFLTNLTQAIGTAFPGSEVVRELRHGFSQACARALSAALVDVVATDEGVHQMDISADNDQELELRAAEAEVARRSGQPGNMLTAALIRLRNAQDALEATR